MNRRVVVFAIALMVLGRFTLTGRHAAVNTVFTKAQAEAGRTAYENSCGKCHTLTLLGRKSVEDGLPPVDSLPASYQEFIRKSKHVPPLAGQEFLSRWGQKTVAQLIARFQVTASDPSFQFQDMNDEAVVNITAYALQVSGAKSGNEPLTRTNEAVVNSLIPSVRR
jgi:cytochrome c2